MIIIYYLIQLWLVSLILCGTIHLAIGTRVPKGILDFFKLTFLPYVMYKLLHNEKF